nr:ABC transporter permease subunit [Clostridium sp. AM58-1XD]
MEHRTEREIKGIFAVLTAIFVIFLAMPVFRLLAESMMCQGTVSMGNYAAVFGGKDFGRALLNSILIAVTSALCATLLAFFLAYAVHYTNIPKWMKKWIRTAAVLPMLLPTITYGFAIIYSFGKQGLITKMAGRQLFEIYGFNGLLIGYVIYVLPVAFLLILNTMEYIDKKFMVVSRVMGDTPLRTFFATLVRPLAGTLAAAIVQSFFLCFTDYGIPASVGGKYDVVATVLYNEMLGSVPDFGRGAVVAMAMLLPSVFSILLLKYLERYNIRYSKVSVVEIPPNKLRDVAAGIGSAVIIAVMLLIFAVIFVVPFVEEWPYRIHFTMKHVKDVFQDASLYSVYKNSLFVAASTAFFGLLAAYGGALVTARSGMNKKLKAVIESIALVTNTIPGMVIGIAFLLIFSGTPLQNTFFLIIICNIIHFFSTPYLMMKGALEKMNSSWETTARLMGDNWIKTLVRIVTPNLISTILEVFGYYFVNAMVTVSAVIFIAGARTSVVTTKIKELQYYTKFNEVFVLSLLILFTNLIVKGLLGWMSGRREIRQMKK